MGHIPVRRWHGRRLLIDGSDTMESRGLLVISALHLAADELQGVQIRVLCGGNPFVPVAVEALRWDTGLAVSSAPPTSLYAELQGVALFVAVVWRSAAHLPLQHIAELGIPAFVPAQYPGPSAGPAATLLARAAHDPRELGRRIVEQLGPS